MAIDARPAMARLRYIVLAQTYEDAVAQVSSLEGGAPPPPGTAAHALAGDAQEWGFAGVERWVIERRSGCLGQSVNAATQAERIQFTSRIDAE